MVRAQSCSQMSRVKSFDVKFLIFVIILLINLATSEGYYIRRIQDYESPMNPSLLEQIQFFKRPTSPSINALYNRNKDYKRIEATVFNNDDSSDDLIPRKRFSRIGGAIVMG